MNTNTHVTLDHIKALLFKAATLDEALDALDANGISYRGEICYVIDSHGVMFWKARRYAFPLVISIDSENQCDTLAQYSAALQSAQALSPEVPATDSPESIAPFLNSCPHCFSLALDTEHTEHDTVLYSVCKDCDFAWFHDLQFHFVPNPDALSTASVDFSPELPEHPFCKVDGACSYRNCSATCPVITKQSTASVDNRKSMLYGFRLEFARTLLRNERRLKRSQAEGYQL